MIKISGMEFKNGTRHQFDLETLELFIEFYFSLVSYFYVISLSYFN